MAIKVKHDGNVTSRIYASAAGGKGKRQSEDAIRLAQLQASASGRGGGTGGGAHASASAPTTHAQTGHAQLGSTGSFVSPQMSPETRMRLADDALTNKLIEMDNADAYRAAAQERQGNISLSNRLAEMDRASEIADQRELTSQGRRERAALVDEVVRAVKEGRYSKEELPNLMESFGEAEDRIMLADALREREPTAQERFDKSIVTDADGNRFYKNAKGDYVPLPNPTAEAQATEAKRQAEEQKKLEAERQKAEQKRAEDRQKYIDKAVEKAENDAENELSIDDLKDVQKKAGERYDELHSETSPVPAQEEAIVQDMREAAARGDLHSLEMEAMGLLPDGFSVKKHDQGVSVFNQDGKALGAVLNDGRVVKYVRDKNGKIAGYDIVEKSAAPWLNSTPASATQPATPVVGDPASFDQFKKRK